MVSLAAGLRHGEALAQRVLACVRAAQALQMSYQELVLTKEPLLLLVSVLRGSPGAGRYRLAADLILGLSLPDSQVTEVLLAQAIDQVQAGRSELEELLTLCPDPVLLGNRLLATAEDLGTFPESDGYGDDCQVGLLVAAHTAHTSRLNLQGISSVLTRARLLVRRLLVKTDFRLMVRLLMGIGRYDEMAYVFELLIREDRLEQLLTAGVSDGRLGAALRRHLMRHHPDDLACLRLVTGRFGHYAEAAADWRRSADALLQPPPLEPAETARQLTEALDAYRHAATFYRHADMLSQADACLRQAQLVALQIAVNSGALSLPSGPALLLRRSREQLHELLLDELPCPAARLVLGAYPDQPVDWSLLLHRQYLCLGRDQYLTDYLAAERHMDETVTAALLKRIRTSGRQYAPARLRALALATKTLELQYRAASQLQLHDVLDELLDRPEAAWLKDTVWKTGGMRPH
ncbi:spatacsin-like [Pollicipes pollicipes]|uniref:spatacsin-like n=1 Tax=Pollicipes pollicipes TaxID=41117 RepID=UPI001885642C|nr:spatacsin-like [Pollicipes pollicipes]